MSENYPIEPKPDEQAVKKNRKSLRDIEIALYKIIWKTAIVGVALNIIVGLWRGIFYGDWALLIAVPIYCFLSLGFMGKATTKDFVAMMWWRKK